MPRLMSRAQSEKDLCFIFTQLDAKLGVSAVGFEGGGGPAIWDDARIARAHGIAIDDASGSVELLHTGRLSPWHRDAVERDVRIHAVLALAPPETQKLLRAAFASCTSWRRVVNHFHTTYLAPLVGLALVLWYESHPSEPRAPSALLESWDNALTKPDEVEERDPRRLEERRKKQKDANAQVGKLLAPLKTRTVEVYDECLKVYDACAAYAARERKSAPDAEIEYERRALRSAEMQALRRRGR